MEVKEKIEQWAIEVATQCDFFAKEIDLDFYPFQSPMPEAAVDFLIIGINPGGSKSYKQAMLEKSEEQGCILIGRTQDMLSFSDNMYAVKPQWEVDAKLKGNDVMRKKLRRVFDTVFLQSQLERSTVMNLYYFNTQNVEKLKHLTTEIKEYCYNKTLDFIDIVSPKFILFLTTSDSELRSVHVQQIQSVGFYIKQGFLGEKKIYAIPNPGFYRAYSYKNGHEIGKIIEQELKK